MLDTTDFYSYQTDILRLKNDVEHLMTGYKTSTGDVSDSYKKVILDKLWKVSRCVGEHYLKVLASISDMETEVLDTTGAQTKKARAELEKLLEAHPSDTLSADSESVPSPQSLTP